MGEQNNLAENINLFEQDQFKNFDDMNVFQHRKANSVQEYIDLVQKFAIFMASFDKPLFTQLNGTLHNASASIFLQQPLTYGHENLTKIQFNETLNGFIPIGGASFTLSRMPYNIGKYLALTGDTLNVHEMMEFGLIDGLMQTDVVQQEIFTEMNKVHKYYQEEFVQGSLNFYGDQVKSNIRNQSSRIKKFLKTISREIQERVIENQSTNNKEILADILYKQEQVKYANRLNHYNEQYQEQQIQNHGQTYNFHALRRLQDSIVTKEYKKSDYFPTDILSKCFSYNTIQEIVNQLEITRKHVQNQQYISQIHSQDYLIKFIDKTISNIQIRPFIAQQLTLDLLNKAQFLPFSACLNLEKIVAINRSKDQDFKDLILQRYNKEYKQNTLKIQIQNEKLDLDQYFVQQVKSDIPDNLMLPKKLFMNEFTDNVRCFLNCQSQNNLFPRQSFNFDVTRWIFSRGINARSSNVNANDIRASIMNVQKQKDNCQQLYQNILNTSNSEYNIKTLIDERNKEINKFFKQSSKTVKKEVDSIISEIFQDRVNDKLNQVQEFGNLAKMKNLRSKIMDIRNIIIEERLKGPENQYAEQINRQLQFTDDYDTSIKDQSNQKLYKKYPIGEILQYIYEQFKDHDQIKLQDILQSDLFKQKLKEISPQDDKIDVYKFMEEYSDFFQQNLEYPQRLYKRDPRHIEYRKWHLRMLDQLNYTVDDIARALGKPVAQYIEQMIQDEEENENEDEFMSADKEDEFILEDKELQESDIQNEESVDQENVDQESDDYEAKPVINTEKIKISGETWNIDKEQPKMNLSQYKIKSIDQNNNREKHIQDIQLEHVNLQTNTWSNLAKYLMAKEVSQQELKREIQQTKQKYKEIIQQIHNDNQTFHGDNFEQNLLTYISNDEQLQILFEVFLQNTNNGSVETFRSQILNNLCNIYQQLYKNHDKYQIIQELSESDTELDKQLLEETNYQINQEIFGYTIQLFSYQTYKELFLIFKKMSNLVECEYKVSDNLKLFVQDKILESPEDFQPVLDYLNDCVEVVSVLQFYYKLDNNQGNLKQQLFNISKQTEYLQDLDDNSPFGLELENYLQLGAEMKQSLLKKYLNIEQEDSINEPYLGLEHTAKEGLEKQQKELIAAHHTYMEQIDVTAGKIINGHQHYIPRQEEYPEITQLKQMQYITTENTPQQWLRYKLKQIIMQFFDLRYQYEQKLTKTELYNVDLELAQNFKPQILKQFLLEELEKDEEILQTANKEQHARNESIYLDEKYKETVEQSKRTILNREALQKYQTQLILLTNKYKNVNYDELSNRQKKQVSKQYKRDKRRSTQLLQEVSIFPELREDNSDSYKQALIKDVLGYGDIEKQKEIEIINRNYVSIQKNNIINNLHKHADAQHIQEDFKSYLAE